MNSYYLYIARNLNGTLRLFDAPPIRNEKSWTPQNNRRFEYLEINNNIFPELQWQDNAKQVILQLQ